MNNKTNLSYQFFYFLGGMVMVMGILSLLVTAWSQLGPVVRLLIPIVFSLFAYYLAIFSIHRNFSSNIAMPFFIIAVILMPLTIIMTFYELNLFTLLVNLKLIMGLSLIACLWSFLCYRRSEILFFLLIYAGLFLLTLVNVHHNFFAYIPYYYFVLCFIGLVYALIREFLFETRPVFSKLLSWLGVWLLLSSLLGLRSMSDGMFHQLFSEWGWNVLIILALCLTFFLSLRWNDLALKILGVFYLIEFTVFFMFKHSSWGWAMVLIIDGIIILLIASPLVKNNKKSEE